KDPMREHCYFVYLMASRTRSLYCGMTNSLIRRVAEHKSGEFEGFSKSHQCHRLVYFERYQYVGNAIARERQIKNWRREKKLARIQEMNPSWADLSEEWFDQRGSAGPSAPLRSGRDDKSFGKSGGSAGPSATLPTPARKDRVPGTPVRSGRDDKSFGKSGGSAGP